jgi:hypothetical protein
MPAVSLSRTASGDWARASVARIEDVPEPNGHIIDNVG